MRRAAHNALYNIQSRNINGGHYIKSKITTFFPRNICIGYNVTVFAAVYTHTHMYSYMRGWPFWRDHQRRGFNFTPSRVYSALVYCIIYVYTYSNLKWDQMYWRAAAAAAVSMRGCIVSILFGRKKKHGSFDELLVMVMSYLRGRYKVIDNKSIRF